MVEIRKDLFLTLLEMFNNSLDDEDITWITVKGHHIPIKAGQNKDKAISNFFEGLKDKKQTNEQIDLKEKETATKGNREAYDKILNEVEASNEKNITGKDVFEEYIKNHPDVNKEELLEKVNFAEEYNDNVLETQKRYRRKDDRTHKNNYVYSRRKLHNQILLKLFENRKNAKVKPNETPTFITLGGRGGSGKSKFRNLVYDPKKFIVLDADAIKEMLPEYRGYNAFEVHEESSDILNMALELARKKKLNVVLDATMKTKKSSEKKINDFKDAGYNIEMYYMHLPREMSSQRAIGRFMGKRGRYVPMDALLGMKDNEKNFNELKKYASKWGFYDNRVPKKEDPPKFIYGN